MDKNMNHELPSIPAGQPPNQDNTEVISSTADAIKNAHATGIGSLGRNDEKLDEGEKNEDEAGIIKD